MQNNHNNDNTVSDYQDLADLMIGQFEKVYEKFDEIDKKLDRKADKSDLLSKADKSDIDRVLTRISQSGDKIDDNRAEQIGMKRQLDKHEKWFLQVAAKVGIKLQP